MGKEYTKHLEDNGQNNEYPQSMFWIKNKNRFTPANPSSFCIKVGFNGVYMVIYCMDISEGHFYDDIYH